jgi:1-acyl-sn-glycerol-3-phosphate acyltransferase
MNDPAGHPAVPVIHRDTVLAPTADIRFGVVQRVANWLIRLIGWKVVGTWPPVKQSVFIVAPHTSNWDFPVGLCAGFSSGILLAWPYGFMMKDVLSRGPLGPIMRWLGGLPIDRSSPNAVVDQMAQVFDEREEFILAVTPEGTRSLRPHWRSGFYYIALKAEVPVVPVAFDYRLKEVGLGEPMTLSGDREADTEVFRRFYQGVTPKRPDKFGPVKFRDVEPSTTRQ